MTDSRKASTLKDIADSLGVSTATVSHALSPNPSSNIKLPEETVRRVREEAEKLNYRVHAGARSIRTRIFQNLGFFMAKRGKAHSPEGLLAGVHDAAEEKGFRITHIRFPESMEDFEKHIPSVLNERNLDAIIIGSYHPVSSLIHEKLKGDNLPVVYLNDKHSSNSVYIDDVFGAETMTRYLVEKGHKRICLTLRKPPFEKMHHSVADRIKGYTKAMENAGLETTIRTVFSQEVVGTPMQYPDDWDQTIDHCDAVFAFDDDLANQIGRYLYKRGIRCPDDISPVGYNGDYGSLSSWIDLATMEIPSYEMGKVGFEMVSNLITNRNTRSEPSIIMKPRLREGASVCDRNP